MVSYGEYHQCQFVNHMVKYGKSSCLSSIHGPSLPYSKLLNNQRVFHPVILIGVSPTKSVKHLQYNSSEHLPSGYLT
jgi:hypothetical protein